MRKTTIKVELVLNGEKADAVNLVWNMLALWFNQDSDLRWYRIVTSDEKKDIYQERG